MIVQRQATRVVILLALMVAIFAATHAAGEQPPQDPADLIAAAQRQFDEGLARAATDAPGARPVFAASAALFQAAADALAQGHVHLETNTGNAWYLAGEPARAIAAFERALSIDAGHRPALDGREAARAELGLDSGPGASWWSRLHDASSLRLAMFVGLALHAVGWLALALVWFRGAMGRARHAARRTRLYWSAAIIALGMVSVGWSVWQRMSLVRVGIVISPGVVGRLGPSAAVYGPAPDSPVLAPGTRVRIGEVREGWVLVTPVGEARPAWVPRTVVDRATCARW